MKIATSKNKAKAHGISKIIKEKLSEEKRNKEDDKVDLIKLTRKLAKRKLDEEKEEQNEYEIEDEIKDEN